MKSSGQKKREESRSLARTKATEKQWQLVEIAISAFVRKYPAEWLSYQKLLKIDGYSNTDDYQLATKEHKELRKANWRHTASFPVIFNEQGEEIDALLPVLEKIIPRLTHKHSVNYVTFLHKFPMFSPARKI